jgi:riboflavin biosynthesis pyrimidine reductase
VIQVSGEDGGFPYGDWTAPYRAPAGRDAIMAAHGESFDLLLGRRRLKSQDGADLILWGSSTLTSTLLEYGLADEVLLVVYPVLLGTGKRFFAEGTPARSFELVSTKAMPSGIIFSTYKVAGPLKTG